MDASPSQCTSSVRQSLPARCHHLTLHHLRYRDRNENSTFNGFRPMNPPSERRSGHTHTHTHIRFWNGAAHPFVEEEEETRTRTRTGTGTSKRTRKIVIYNTMRATKENVINDPTLRSVSSPRGDQCRGILCTNILPSSRSDPASVNMHGFKLMVPVAQPVSRFPGAYSSSYFPSTRYLLHQRCTQQGHG